MAAVCGFEHTVWAVRNSSMMLFASIMQRAVGGAKNAAGPSNPYLGANFSVSCGVRVNCACSQTKRERYDGHGLVFAFLSACLRLAVSRQSPSQL